MSCPYVPPPSMMPRPGALASAIDHHDRWHWDHPAEPCQYAEPEPAALPGPCVYCGSAAGTFRDRGGAVCTDSYACLDRGWQGMPRARARRRSPAALALIAAIRAYQLFVPRFLKGRCPMEPHCSQYGLEAVREHGAARGLVLTCKRIWSCR